MKLIINKTRLQFLIIILFQYSGNLFAQNLYLKGKLTSDNDGGAIVGATVILLNTEKHTTTDALGNFNFNGLTQGNYQLVITCMGFTKVTKEVILKDNQRQNFSLIPATIDLTEVTVSPTKPITQSEAISGLDKLLRPVNTA